MGGIKPSFQEINNLNFINWQFHTFFYAIIIIFQELESRAVMRLTMGARSEGRGNSPAVHEVSIHVTLPTSLGY